jgi:predicted transcriptional regulator
MEEVLLSVKPEFAKKIFNGTKRYEYRRTIFKSPHVKKVMVYASSPVKKVIGEFEIEAILNLDLDTLWAHTHAEAGISKEYFFEYFKDKENGYAIKIKSYKEYEEPLCIQANFNAHPPQSFIYI